MNKLLLGINAQEHSMSLQSQSDSLGMSLNQSLFDVPASGSQLFIFIKQTRVRGDRDLTSARRFRVGLSRNEWDKLFGHCLALASRFKFKWIR